MTHWFSNNGLEVLLASTASMFLAQGHKFFWLILTKRSVNFKRLVQTGGMPSSHSSTMSAMATAVGLVDGFASVTFAIALSIALIVMYDAAGLRQAAGRMATVLNRITEDIYSHHSEHVPERLRELLGHTPFEVFVGSLLGISMAVVVHAVVA